MGGLRCPPTGLGLKGAGSTCGHPIGLPPTAGDHHLYCARGGHLSQRGRVPSALACSRSQCSWVCMGPYTRKYRLASLAASMTAPPPPPAPGLGASKGQVWTHPSAPAAPAFPRPSSPRPDMYVYACIRVYMYTQIHIVCRHCAYFIDTVQIHVYLGIVCGHCAK